MELVNKTIHLIHDDDSYEIIVSPSGQIVEIWRYKNNRTRKPEFIRLEWLDEILQDRINDRLVAHFGDSDINGFGS